MENSKKLKLITIIIVSIMFICLLVLFLQFIKIGNLKSKTSYLETTNAELEREITDYSTQNAYYSNSTTREEYLSRYAREVLGWGKTGETWYSSN